MFLYFIIDLWWPSRLKLWEIFTNVMWSIERAKGYKYFFSVKQASGQKFTYLRSINRVFGV